MSIRRALVAVTSVHAALGFWIAVSTPGPLLAADDVAYLGLARTIAGDGAIPIPAQPPYGWLYPTLLSPGWLVGLDEGSMVTFARGVNAVLGAALVPLLYLFARRVLKAAPWSALFAAAIGASLPAAMLHSSIVWTETLLPVLVVGGLLLLHRFEARPGLGAGIPIVVAAGLQVAAHPRALATAVVLVIAMIVIALRRGLYAEAGFLAALAGAGFVLVEVVRRATQDAAFGSSGTYDAGDLVDRRGLDDVGEMIIHGLGAVAYLLLATAVLAGVGCWILARSGVTGWVTLASLAATLAMAGWFLTGVERADSWLHGRYVEVIAGPLVVAGVIGLREMSRRYITDAVAVTVAAGVLAAWAGPGNNWNRPRSPVMMLGVEPAGAPFGNDIFEAGSATSVAILVLLAAWAMARWREYAVLIPLGIAVTIGALSGLETLDQLYETSIAGETRELLADDVDTIAIDIGHVGPATAVAVAWQAGLGNTVTDPSRTDVSHVLLAAGAPPPEGATGEGITIGSGVLYELSG